MEDKLRKLMKLYRDYNGRNFNVYYNNLRRQICQHQFCHQHSYNLKRQICQQQFCHHPFYFFQKFIWELWLKEGYVPGSWPGYLNLCRYYHQQIYPHCHWTCPHCLNIILNGSNKVCLDNLIGIDPSFRAFINATQKYTLGKKARYFSLYLIYK